MAKQLLLLPNKFLICHFPIQQQPMAMAMATSFLPCKPTASSPLTTLAKPVMTNSHSSSFATKAASNYSSTKGDELPERVGFLGLGIMGSPMALNLLKAGCDVTVWNRTKSKCDHLIDLGAKYQPSPAEVASSCNITFAMLADPESAVAVACGTNGAAEGMGPGKGYVDVSTVDVATSKLIGKHINRTGASFLEAPVSGSKKPAEDGQLIFLTAGDATLYETVAPLLDIMGKVQLSNRIPSQLSNS